MKHYYSSQELAKLYNVSRRTVTNWVQQTKDGKLDLELVDDKDETYIVRSRVNQVRIQKIVKERRKYLNQRSRKEITPVSSFYKTFAEHQIHDMIHSLLVYKELPLKYSYFGKGADLWNNFRISHTQKGPFDAEFLLEANISYLDTLLRKYKKVNIIDVGVGNGSAVYPIINHLQKNDRLNRYVGIDISQDMLNIALGNINEWFGDKVKTEGYIRDVTEETFGDLISEPPSNKTQEQEVVNIVLILGGSISNFKDTSEVLKTLHKSMGPEDLLISNFKLVTPEVKEQVSFITYYHEQCKLILDMIGLDESLYDFEVGSDDELGLRYGRIRLKRTVQIKFELEKGNWFVNLSKDEAVTTFRAHYNYPFSTPETMFYKNDFYPLHIAQTQNHEGMMVIADLRI